MAEPFVQFYLQRKEETEFLLLGFYVGKLELIILEFQAP